MPPYRWIGFNFVNVVYEGCFSRFNFIYNDLDSFLLMEDGALLQRGVVAACWRQVHHIKIVK